MTKPDKAWDKLFDKYDILKHVDDSGFFSISADQIREFAEPRLVTKFDWTSRLPKRFRDNKLAILPSTRGTYVIGKFKAYKDLKVENIKPIHMQLPAWVQTWNGETTITSESVALNVAKASGMIDYLLESDPDYPAIDTITGRLKSGDLNYKIDIRGTNNAYDFKVENAQVEIDGGYENTDTLAVVEAKMIIPSDFMIRQLYYPYRVYNALGTDKPIIPFYFTYVDNIFNFYQFKFTDLNNYSSIRQVKQFSFILDQELDLNLDVVKAISARSPMNPEPNKPPYPQANNFQLVIDTINYLNVPKNSKELADIFEFDTRQGNYYGDCVVFLGLGKKVKDRYELNDLGRRISSLPNSNSRNELIIKQILDHVTFKLVFDSYLKNNGVPDNDYIYKVIKEHVKGLADSTIQRRLSTVKNWISWIFSVID